MGDFQTLPSIGRFVLEAGAVLLCLLVPGVQILRRILGEGWRRMALFRKAGHALLVSTVVLAALQSLIWILPAPAVKFLDIAVFLGCLVCGVIGFRTWRNPRVLWDAEYGFQIPALAVLLVGIAWSASPAVVPGPVAAGYGDLASYYRAIDNLSSGNFPLIDFRISEFVGELYFMPRFYPLLTLLGAFFTTILPGSQHLLLVIASIYALLGMFFCGGYLYEKFRSRYVDAHLIVFSFGLLFLLPYNHPEHLAFGALTLPVMTLALILMDLVGSPSASGRVFKFSMVGLCAAAVTLMRPEGLLLIALMLALSVLYFVVEHLTRRFGIKATVLVVSTAVLLAIVLAPFFPVSTSFSFCYLHYYKSLDTFEFHNVAPTEWPRQDTDTYDVNADHAREVVGLSRLKTELNPEIYSQIRAHPRAFATWLAEVIIEQVGGVSLMLLLAATVRLMWTKSGQLLVLAALGPLYVMALACINSAFNARHLLPTITILLAMSIRSFEPNRGREILEAATGRFAVRMLLITTLTFFAISLEEAHEMRLEERTFAHTLVLEPLKERVDHSTVVASTYPPMVSYMLRMPSIGAATLTDIVDAYAKTYLPDVLVLDSNGLSAIYPEGFDEGMDFVECGLADDLGYQVVVLDKTRRFMILDRRPGALAESLHIVPAEIIPAPYKMASGEAAMSDKTVDG